MTEHSSEEKPLQTASFVIHATRGLIRHQKTRRKVMLSVIVIALVLLASGSTFLQTLLEPREHPGRFILFWIVCAWLTLTAIFLAIFDLLMVRIEARNARRALREKTERTSSNSTPE